MRPPGSARGTQRARAMALAVASQRCRQPLRIEGAECVRKSYPDFWKDFETLGGMIEKEEG